MPNLFYLFKLFFLLTFKIKPVKIVIYINIRERQCQQRNIPEQRSDVFIVNFKHPASITKPEQVT